MNSSRQSVRLQHSFAHRVATSDSNALFNLLTDELMFDKLESLLPEHRERLYTPTQTLAMFMTQALHSDRSCQQIVNEMAAARDSAQMKPLSTRTGAYCRARQRMPLALPRELTRHCAKEMIDRLPAGWLWKGRAVKLVDGTTLSMPDTQANQERFAQSQSQQPGVGFPICRLVGLMCLGCGALIDIAYGPYQGKQTGEQSLLRPLLDNLQDDDVLLGDAFYGTYFLLCELQQRGVDGVFEQMGGRKKATDFRRGKSLGRKDHLVSLKRPKKPDWMSQEAYRETPKSITVRELCTGGKAAKTLITTLVDSKAYPKKALKQLYRDRWQVEVNFRHIKTTMGLDVLSCQSPQMIEKEIWVSMLAYNLIRLLMAQSALLVGISPNQLSFKHTVQLWLCWTQRGRSLDDELLFVYIAQRRVGNRAGRVEPRAVKRRPKNFPKLQEPRHVARKKILKFGHPPKLK